MYGQKLYELKQSLSHLQWDAFYRVLKRFFPIQTSRELVREFDENLFFIRTCPDTDVDFEKELFDEENRVERDVNDHPRNYLFDGNAIKRILAANAKPRTLESFLNDKARQQLGRSLPEIKQRCLNEYMPLLNNKSKEAHR